MACVKCTITNIQEQLELHMWLQLPIWVHHGTNSYHHESPIPKLRLPRIDKAVILR
ncbi:DNA-binding response regulator [Sesbania bispinosa]|nr:DNA-binding response regulator [Sesbania bispinosa]